MARKRKSSRAPDTAARNRNILIGGVVLLVVFLFCSSAVVRTGSWLAGLFDNPEPQPQEEVANDWADDSAELTIAASPLMAPILEQIAESFNAEARKTADGQTMSVRITSMAPEAMVQASLGAPPFQAISPDSSLWLDQLEQAWTAQHGEAAAETLIPLGQTRTSEPFRYAVSPVVIAAWEDVARELGWPDQPVGWRDIQRKATEDTGFQWNHAGTNTASGILATLAEFYAGAGLTRGLTIEDATAQSTLDYVRAVESTVQFYGEGEEVIVQRLAEEGRDLLDAFVGQEQVVVAWNARHPDDPLVAIYPAEGTLWTDHPLALLELGRQPYERAVTANQRTTYRAFADFLRTSASQSTLMEAGYRPADLNIDLGASTSPFANSAAVTWREPQTTLQMPSPAVIDVVRDAWYYTKRPTNVYLVVDTSGSMEGAKLESTREALAAFVGQIRGDRDRVGIVEFGDSTKNFLPLRPLDEAARSDTLAAIDGMEALGNTALLDAVYAATRDLRDRGDTEAINAIVVMTDGLDNSSYYSMRQLRTILAQQEPAPIVVFTIAFGDDADDSLLAEIAQAGHGQFRRADETDIKELYRVISTYF